MSHKPLWAFFIWRMTGDNGRMVNTFEKVQDSYLKWPTSQFSALAARLGFDRPQKDTTLIGGYYARNGGDCLICIPAQTTPERIYLES
jgi:hypothetical protein